MIGGSGCDGGNLLVVSGGRASPRIKSWAKSKACPKDLSWIRGVNVCRSGLKLCFVHFPVLLLLTSHPFFPFGPSVSRKVHPATPVTGALPSVVSQANVEPVNVPVTTTMSCIFGPLFGRPSCMRQSKSPLLLVSRSHVCTLEPTMHMMTYFARASRRHAS